MGKGEDSLYITESAHLGIICNSNVFNSNGQASIVSSIVNHHNIFPPLACNNIQGSILSCA
jgi:hypothetical protein